MKATLAKPPQRGAPAKPRAVRPRDAVATAKLITDAALRLLAEHGFTGLGVNALASAAGVDKQLIYYHFGGLEGVVRQLGSELELWLGTALEPRAGEAYGDAVERLMLEYAGALRRNRLVLRLLAWELVEPSDVLKELEVTRSAAMAHWMTSLRDAAQSAPVGVDAPAINAILLAALHYLALREHAVGSFAGVDIRNREGSARIEAALRFITAQVYRAPARPVSSRSTS